MNALDKDLYIERAKEHGAKLDCSPDGWWRVLDHSHTVLWWTYFRTEATAAYAFLLHHGYVV